MNNKVNKLIRLIYGIIVSIMIAISGLLLMAACLQIYQSDGEQIYTPDKVAAAFAPIGLPVYITLALIVGSFLLDFLLPVEKKRKAMQKQYPLLLRIAYKRADMSLCNPELVQLLEKQQKKRRLVLILTLAIWALGGIVFLPYACNIDHYYYGEQLSRATESVVAMVWLLLPCCLIPTGFSIFAAYYSRANIRRELELVKLAPKAVNKPAPEAATDKLPAVRIAVLSIALSAIIAGFIAGGTADVLAKAVAICTECVGLG